MNMHAYYKQKAVISLNAGIAALIPPLYFIFYGLINPPPKHLVWLLFPFLVYSFICYQSYLINKKRYNETNGVMEVAASIEGAILAEGNLMITFLPSPTLHMQFYDSSGNMRAELKDFDRRSLRWFIPYIAEKFINQSYGLYDHAGQLIATFIMSKNKIEIIGKDEKANLHFKSQRNTGFIEFQDHNRSKSYYVEKSLFHMNAKIFINSSVESVSLQKGFLPMSYSKVFKDANTPLLTFHKELQQIEKLSIMAILANYLYTVDH